MMLRELLERVARGEMSVAQAERAIRLLAIAEVGEMAKLDVGRRLRAGVPEVIFGEGKPSDQLVKMLSEALQRQKSVIVSRLAAEQIESLRAGFADGYDVVTRAPARALIIRRRGYRPKPSGGKVGIITAGTSDIPVAEEARLMAEELGCRVVTAYDVGVAGLHRLFPHVEAMVKDDVDAIVVVAGMEGALPSLVAGLVDVPVIGVPTSLGYGLGGKGVGALITMLQSCSLGLTVVNIDNGFGAGAVAALIANRVAKARAREPLPKGARS